MDLAAMISAINRQMPSNGLTQLTDIKMTS